MPSRSTQAGARHREHAEPSSSSPPRPPALQSPPCPPPLRLLPCLHRAPAPAFSPQVPCISLSRHRPSRLPLPLHLLRLHRAAPVIALHSGLHRSQHRSPSPFAAIVIFFSSHFLTSVATPSPVFSSSLPLSVATATVPTADASPPHLRLSFTFVADYPSQLPLRHLPLCRRRPPPLLLSATATSLFLHPSHCHPPLRLLHRLQTDAPPLLLYPDHHLPLPPSLFFSVDLHTPSFSAPPSPPLLFLLASSSSIGAGLHR